MVSYETLEKQELIELLEARDIEIEILSVSISRILKDNLNLKKDLDESLFGLGSKPYSPDLTLFTCDGKEITNDVW